MATPSVVLVVFDAMRKDVLPAYGGSSHTPNLDAFCAEASVYRDCLAPSPWTIPSHASMFTGKFANEHGVHESYERGMPETLGLMKDVAGFTLAENLRSKGYQTLGLPGNGMLSLREGFDRGFERFKAFDRKDLTPDQMALMRDTFAKGKGKTGTVLDLISRGEFEELWELYTIYRKMQKARKVADFPRSKGGDFLLDSLSQISLTPPFFLFVNFLETHEPYTAFEQKHSNLGPFNSVHNADLYEYKAIPAREVQDLKRAYSGTVSKADQYFGRLVSLLKKGGHYDESLIIATSDHGQEFKEHGFYTHGTFLHDEIVEVPLVVKYPRGRRPDIGPGYQNLRDVYDLVMKTCEGQEVAIDSTQETFSESFGVVHKPPPVGDRTLRAKCDQVRQRVDRPRKAIFREGCKLVVFWDTKEVEEFSRMGKELDQARHRSLLDSLLDDLLTFERTTAQSTPRAAPMSAEEEALVSERLRDLGYLG